MTTPRTLFEKIWDAHIVRPQTAEAPAVLYIDLQLIHEVTSPQAFTEMRQRGLTVRRYTKPTYTKPMPPDLRREIAAECDVVIEALAD